MHSGQAKDTAQVLIGFGGRIADIFEQDEFTGGQKDKKNGGKKAKLKGTEMLDELVRYSAVIAEHCLMAGGSTPAAPRPDLTWRAVYARFCLIVMILSSAFRLRRTKSLRRQPPWPPRRKRKRRLSAWS